MQQLAVHADVVAAGVGLGAQLGDDFAVDLDAALLDQLFGAAAAGDAGLGHDLLEPLEFGGRTRLGGGSGLGVVFVGVFGGGVSFRLGAVFGFEFGLGFNFRRVDGFLVGFRIDFGFFDGFGLELGSGLGFGILVRCV